MLLATATDVFLISKGPTPVSKPAETDNSKLAAELRGKLLPVRDRIE